METAPDQLSNRRLDVGGVEVNLLEGSGDGIPTVLVHGVPTHSEIWRPIMEEIPGPRFAPDLPGFGASGPPAPGKATLHGYSELFAALLVELRIDRYNLVVSDWGALTLHTAQSHPERINRLVIIDSVPLLPGYRWHWIARMWRRRVIGEIFVRAANRFVGERLLRRASGGEGGMPDDFVDLVWEAWDRQTQDAILSLYRSADPQVLEAAGADLDSIEAPTMVIWGSKDPYVPVRFGRMYADRIPNADMVELSRAGHWPWIDRPEAIERITGFLAD